MVMMHECPETMLGTLKPVCDFSDGSAVISGVTLPRLVVEELRRLGMPLMAYTSGELEDAKDACAHDGQLVDDRDGDHFRDKLTLTDDEKKRRHRKERPDCHYRWRDRLEHECHADEDEIGIGCFN